MFGEFSSGEQGAAAEAGEIVTIGVADSADEPVQAQPFEDAADLGRSLGCEQPAQSPAT